MTFFGLSQFFLFHLKDEAKAQIAKHICASFELKVERVLTIFDVQKSSIIYFFIFSKNKNNFVTTDVDCALLKCMDHILD